MSARTAQIAERRAKRFDAHVVGRYYGRKIHAREVVAIDEAGDNQCWIRTVRHGDEWVLIHAKPAEVAAKVREVRQVPEELPLPPRFQVGAVEFDMTASTTKKGES